MPRALSNCAQQNSSKKWSKRKLFITKTLCHSEHRNTHALFGSHGAYAVCAIQCSKAQNNCILKLSRYLNQNKCVPHNWTYIFIVGIKNSPFSFHRNAMSHFFDCIICCVRHTLFFPLAHNFKVNQLSPIEQQPHNHSSGGGWLIYWKIVGA